MNLESDKFEGLLLAELADSPSTMTPSSKSVSTIYVTLFNIFTPIFAC